MFQELSIFRMAHAMAVHAGKRQALLSQNMANVDTPNYKPRDLVPFADTVKTQSPTDMMRATRRGHLGQGTTTDRYVAIMANAELAPNGNGVSIESEMLKAVDAQRQHSRALAIYKSSLNILRTSMRAG